MRTFVALRANTKLSDKVRAYHRTMTKALLIQVFSEFGCYVFIEAYSEDCFSVLSSSCHIRFASYRNLLSRTYPMERDLLVFALIIIRILMSGIVPICFTIMSSHPFIQSIVFLAVIPVYRRRVATFLRPSVFFPRKCKLFCIILESISGNGGNGIVVMQEYIKQKIRETNKKYLLLSNCFMLCSCRERVSLKPNVNSFFNNWMYNAQEICWLKILKLV